MLNEYSRTELLIGTDNIKRLAAAKVAVFGIGGVGSYVVEGLARCGIGSLTLIDHDEVSRTNINRQNIALQSTVGQKKTRVAKERIHDIDPDILVHTYEIFYNQDTQDILDFSQYDYVIDAIDTVSAKLLIIENAKKAGIPVISSMGTGNKLDASRFEITDIAKTSVCPLAKVMRTELRKRGIRKVKVLYSREQPIKPQFDENQETKGNTQRPVPGSISFVPSVAGLLIAGEVVRDLIQR
ncbi:MAG: tRNA threonylcarbamoyladenosine dehydratase [Lachnospiraceae bacterium]|jgi:tRNA A37 threonylcarbamoyladenosine dehydratase|nr:tRNA threonylcarbamoyladenosine dehydratase [Lachnospiraceae bacterium]MDD3616892.1 tRNA threonylcarbamoyladenosine dehydratase [Lachnospiraceae bacterium]